MRRAIHPDRRATTLAQMARLVLLLGAVVAGAVVLVRRAIRGSRGPVPRVSPASARGLVEAVLGRKPVRRQLTLDFEPATATSWELLIDGASFFPAAARGHRSGDVGRATS
jgi:hypothetical protein